uniref:MFS domain-containing protein n=1 Tax=Caenorhabditis tropicalis TaxID=1561998 RepID=A0A1I7TXB4_9PELO
MMTMIGGVQGAGWVPATKLIQTWFDDSSYATMFSILGCGSTFAGLILPLFKSFYWRTVELNSGLIVLLFALVCKKWIITEDAIRKEVKPVKKVDLEAEKANGIKKIVTNSVIWHIALIYFFSMEMRTICETWVPLYLNERKVSVDGFQCFYELGGLIGALTSGLMLDKLSSRIGVDLSRRLLGIWFTTSMMLISIGLFNYEQYSTIFGLFTGFFVLYNHIKTELRKVNKRLQKVDANSKCQRLFGQPNIWCLISSQAGARNVSGSVSALISFIASVGSIFAGSSLAHLIAEFSYDIFVVLFITQIIFVLSVSSLRIPLRIETELSEKKSI